MSPKICFCYYIVQRSSSFRKLTLFYQMYLYISVGLRHSPAFKRNALCGPSRARLDWEKGVGKRVGRCIIITGPRATKNHQQFGEYFSIWVDYILMYMMWYNGTTIEKVSYTAYMTNYLYTSSTHIWKLHTWLYVSIARELASSQLLCSEQA